jgi:hypothetical protein
MVPGTWIGLSNTGGIAPTSGRWGVILIIGADGDLAQGVTRDTASTPYCSHVHGLGHSVRQVLEENDLPRLTRSLRTAPKLLDAAEEVNRSSISSWQYLGVRRIFGTGLYRYIRRCWKHVGYSPSIHTILTILATHATHATPHQARGVSRLRNLHQARDISRLRNARHASANG